MFYRLIKTILLVSGSTNPANIAIQITQLIIYPAFILLSLISLHLCLELYLKYRGDYYLNPTQHIGYITRVVIESFVYTMFVTIWTQAFDKLKEYTMYIVDTFLRISQSNLQNQLSIACIEFFTILTIFSLYFDLQFYIYASNALLISNIFNLRFIKPLEFKDNLDTENNILSLYNKIKKKKVVHIVKNYWETIVKQTSETGVSISQIEIKKNRIQESKNVADMNNILKIKKINGEELIYSNASIILNSSKCLEDEYDWTEVETEYFSNCIIECIETNDDKPQYYFCHLGKQYVILQNF